MMSPSNDLCYLAAASSAALVGACADVRTRRIPNALSGCSLVLALFLHLLMGGPKDLALSMLAGLGAGTLLLVMYVAGGMGAGDVKLMAAVACLAGMPSLKAILTGTFLSGAVFGIVLAMYHRRLRNTIGGALLLIGQRRQKDTLLNESQNPVEGEASIVQGLTMPYAVPIAAGCLMTLGTLVWKG